MTPKPSRKLAIIGSFTFIYLITLTYYLFFLLTHMHLLQGLDICYILL